MGKLNFRYRLIWGFSLIVASLISFSALTPHGDTKSSPERFLKIAKWKLSVSWQASGSFEDSLKNEGGSLSVKSTVQVSGGGEYLLVKGPGDGAYEWGTPEGENPNVSVSYNGHKTLIVSHGGGTFHNDWSYKGQRPDGGSAKLEINADAGTYDVYAVVYFLKEVISPPSGSKPEIVHDSISMSPRDSEFRKKNLLPDSGFNLSGSHEFLAMLAPLNEVDPQVKKKLPLMAPWARMNVNWTLTPAGEEDVEAVIETPKDYENWQPAAEKTEDKAGPLPIIVNVRLHKKGEKDKPASRRARFRFELVDTTKEKGVCLNWPAANAQDTYDLRIEQDKNKDLEVLDDKEGQKAKTKKNASGAAVTISCFDWGAFARLKVTAILDDGYGSEVLAYLDSDKSKHDLEIPKDADDNYIADVWEKKNGVYGGYAEDDKDTEPEGDGDSGDGLTLYEEYRGFMENGKHIFGDPKKKDLFICNKIGQMAELGISVFENISGLAVHSKLKPGGRSGPGELDASRIINLNHTNMAHIVDQHGVFIEKGDEGLTSEAEGTEGYENINGPPKTCKKVKIGKGLLGREYSAYERSSTVAHELLHGCSVWHHGRGDMGVRKFQAKTDAAGVKRIFVFDVDDDGNAVGTGTAIILYKETGGAVDPDEPVALAGFKLWVGSKQGQHSGDKDCVMRYDCAHVYLNSAGRYVGFGDPEEFGLSLCANGQGTGVNEPGRKPEPRYGNATAGKGDCKKQICVNDKYH
jgi:hypothetical protein